MSDIVETKKYKQFKILKGNRELDDQHVRRLVRRMTESGNLTQDFPVIVNERMEVIDGQHRLAALQELGWPVFYMVRPNLTIDTVRVINTAQKNWNWLDYAKSYAEAGNKSYQQFLALHERFPSFSFSILIHFCNDESPGNRVAGERPRRNFFNGDFTMPNYVQILGMLKKLEEIHEVCEHEHMTRDLGLALHAAMMTPGYRHDRMTKQMLKLSADMLPYYRSVKDYLRALEAMYNHGYPDSNHLRFF